MTTTATRRDAARRDAIDRWYSTAPEDRCLMSTLIIYAEQIERRARRAETTIVADDVEVTTTAISERWSSPPSGHRNETKSVNYGRILGLGARPWDVLGNTITPRQWRYGDCDSQWRDIRTTIGLHQTFFVPGSECNMYFTGCLSQWGTVVR